jgi:copper chaperone CopZ
MNVVSSYIHALEGRLRIKIPEVKGAPLKALEVENHLQLLTGMEEVSANTITGNVLILYDPRRVNQEEIVSALRELGYLEEASPRAHGATGRGARPVGAVELLTSTVASTLMEVALSRLVASLI